MKKAYAILTTLFFVELFLSVELGRMQEMAQLQEENAVLVSQTNDSMREQLGLKVCLKVRRDCFPSTAEWECVSGRGETVIVMFAESSCITENIPQNLLKRGIVRVEYRPLRPYILTAAVLPQAAHTHPGGFPFVRLSDC